MTRTPGRRLRRAAAERLAHGYRAWARGRRLTDADAVAAWALGFVARRRYCLVVTAGDGVPAARVVEPFAPRDGVIRFGTDPASRKAADIRRDGRCLLVYQDDRRRACVTLERDAVLEDGARPPFKPFWRAFWPDGPTEDFVVVACRPTALEAWSGTAVIAPEPFGRRSIRLVLREGRWQPAG